MTDERATKVSKTDGDVARSMANMKIDNTLNLARDSDPVTLVTCDDVKCLVDRQVVKMMGMVTTFLECQDEDDSDDEDDDDNEFPLPGVTHEELQKAVEFCIHHESQPLPEIQPPIMAVNLVDIVPEWYAGLFKDMPTPEVNKVSRVARYLDIAPYNELTAAVIAMRLRNKTPREMCKEMGIDFPYTDEEYAKIEKEYEWCLNRPELER